MNTTAQPHSAEITRNLIIRCCTEADSERLTDFRIAQFKTAKEFRLNNPAPLRHLRGLIYLIEENDQIVSTMQIERSADSESFREICSAYVPPSFSRYDTLYLSKAATSKEYRNTGINSVLRTLALKSAIDDPKISSLTGVAYEFAPRLSLLVEMGYKLIEVEHAYTDYTIRKGRVFFLLLEREHFGRAYELISSRVNEIQKQLTIINKIVV